jgi:hypothetical protein
MQQFLIHLLTLIHLQTLIHRLTTIYSANSSSSGCDSNSAIQQQRPAAPKHRCPPAADSSNPAKI